MQLVPPDNLKWRLIKLRTLDDRWIPVRVRETEQLNRLVKHHKAIEVYYSCSCYQNPLRAENPSYMIDSKVLWTDDIYDIDNDQGDLDSAWNTTLNIMQTLGEPEQIRFTGAKGYLIDYGKKKEFTGHLKEIFIKENKLYDNNLDIPVSIDKKRVVRMVGSPNIKTGKICQVIHDPVRYQVPMTNHYKMDNSIVEPGGLCGPGLTQASFYIALSNKIAKDIYAPYLYHQNMPNENMLRNIQKTYNLPSFYIFKTGKTYVSICLKPVSKRRCIKIMKAANSRGWKTLDKYTNGTHSQLWMRTSTEITSGFEITTSSPELVSVIHNDYPSLQSTPHYGFVKKHTEVKEMPYTITPKRNIFRVFKKKVTL